MECVNGELTAIPRPSRILEGSQLEIAVTFDCTGGAHKILNPFWDTAHRLPGTVSVFDEQRKYIGEIVSESESTSATGELPAVLVRCDNVVGAIRLVPTGPTTVVADVGKRNVVQVLGPGIYFVQATLLETCLYANRPSIPLAVSRPERIEVVPRSQSKRIVDELFAEFKAHRFTNQFGERNQSMRADSVQSVTTRYGHLELTMSKTSLEVEELAHARLRYTNTTGQPITLYNVFSLILAKPLGTRIYTTGTPDEPLWTKSHYGSGSHFWANYGLFTTLPANAIAGTTLNYFGGEGVRNRTSRRDRLAPGTYFVRAAYTEYFFAPNVFAPDSDKNLENWLNDYSEKPVLVSNAVRIQLK